MAELSEVNINESNNAIGSVEPQQDGICAKIITAIEFVGILDFGSAYQLFSLAEAEAINIDEVNNPFAHTIVKAFYAAAGNGAELWLMPIANTVTMEDALDVNGNYAPVLLNAAGGNIKLLTVSSNPAAPSVVANGLEGDVHAAVIKAQQLAQSFRDNHQPLSIILDGRGFNGTPGDLTDYVAATHDSVSIFISGSVVGDSHSDLGTFLGVLSRLPVQRKMSRKRNGPVPVGVATLTDGVLVDESVSKFTAIAAKNYIFLRTYVGQTGYFYSTDSTLAAGDFKTISSRRVMDKVRRIAYAVYLEWLDDEITVNTNGTIDEAEIESLQQAIKNQVNLEMVANGELSSFTSFFDPAQNVLSTSELVGQLQPTPVGYATRMSIEVSYNNPFLNA